jgi:uncharacterized protein (UPF0332 family)
LKPEQIALLRKAGESLRAAELLAANELLDFAASRAYYTMFIAQAEQFLELAERLLVNQPPA